jgi:predicted GH43/DUF377 family glycosyl hydrolase
LKGCGPPPIKTEEGWLLFYHAIDRKEPWKYKVGAILLDLEKPEKCCAGQKHLFLNQTNGTKTAATNPESSTHAEPS